MSLSSDLAARLRFLFLRPGSTELIGILETPPITETAAQVSLTIFSGADAKLHFTKLGTQVVANLEAFSTTWATASNTYPVYPAATIPAGFRPVTGNGGISLPWLYLRNSTAAVGSIVFYDDGALEIYESAVQGGFTTADTIALNFPTSFSWTTDEFD